MGREGAAVRGAGAAAGTYPARASGQASGQADGSGPGSGVEGAPVRVDAYGTGAEPRIQGGGSRAAVLLENVEQWEVR
ncbi:hypothetical protein ACFWP3_02275 [Streptomyces sp. NPDC058525]|uniref:hypothetical protein n=1 Tax=Streptomyces sp. NPDC058525 TaxID=3346538 RepID=UPI00365DE6E4